MKVKVKIKDHYDPFTDKEAEEREAEYYKILEDIGVIEKEDNDPFNPKNLGELEEITLENEDDEGIDWKEKYKSLLKDYIKISLKLSNFENKTIQLKNKLESLKYENEDLSNRLDESENKQEVTDIDCLKKCFNDYKDYVDRFASYAICNNTHKDLSNLDIFNSLTSIFEFIIKILES